MAEETQRKGRKRKHFETEKSRQSPFQNASTSEEAARIVSKAPRGINAAEYAESRALEIHNMMEALSSASKQSNKRVFQSLPRHMRRRAASHNSKRMPVRLRNAYNREALKSQEKPKEPKPKKSRRHRRKPSNLLEEYNRRQRKHVWLETHIWHAKRFKMVEQWGYKIPLHPSDKSVRASYRAMANGCLMQDISYYQCIEVHGRQEKIATAMKHLTSPDIGLTMAASEYLDGSHEGHTILYKCDQYPYHAIGPVIFLWQQHLDKNKQDSNEMTKLWVWSHPACSDEVVKEIVHACSLEGPTQHTHSKLWLSTKSDEVTDSKVTSHQVTSSGNASEFTVTVLEEQLVRLRFIGPKSHALLAATFELCDWSTDKDEAGSQWWEKYNAGEDSRKMLEEQNKSWEGLRSVPSPGILKAGSVMALVVKDPRLGLPVKKSSIDMAAEDLYKDVSSEKPTLITCRADSAVSPLWDCAVRKAVKDSKMPEKDLNNLRSKQPVPGSKLDLGDDTSRIPILLIQRPGNYQPGSVIFGSGYDVIFPAGWSMAFWIALVYRGARVGGTRELTTCSREQGVPHFPCDFPDTKAGREYNEDQKKSGEEKYKRYPPAKRPNYEKFGVVNPFAPDWETLVNEWRSEVMKLQIDMRKVTLTQNNNLNNSHYPEDGVHISTLKDNRAHCRPCVDDPKAISNDTEACNVDSSVLNGTEGDEILQDSVVGDCERTVSNTTNAHLRYNVIRTFSTRRRLQDIILSLKLSTKKKRTQSKNISNEDIFEFLIKSIALRSRSLVCLNLRPVFKGSPQDNAVIYIPALQDLRDLKKDKNYGGPVEHVHKGNTDTSSTMIGQCSRKAIGWVTSGQFSFARGQGSAVGFCTFPGFCELILTTAQEKCSPLVLIRNTNTFQYRFANVIVV